MEISPLAYFQPRGLNDRKYLLITVQRRLQKLYLVITAASLLISNIIDDCADMSIVRVWLTFARFFIHTQYSGSSAKPDKLLGKEHK